MPFASPFDRRSGSPPTPHLVSSATPRRRRALRPTVLELLEGRVLPSAVAISVTSLADSGAGSLRDAIAVADGGPSSNHYTINFKVTGAITLESALPSLNNAISLVGPGSRALTIRRDPLAATNFGVFTVGAGREVAMSGLTISQGLSNAPGGGVSNAGTLTTLDVTISGNSANSALGGGGVYNAAGATLVLDLSSVLDNTAVAAPGADVFGGGLLNLGSATIRSCLFQGNQAVGGSGLDFFGGSAGGGVDNFGGAWLDATGTTFRQNQAIGAADDANGSYYGMGGGFEGNAGFADDSPSTATFTDCVFVNNVATAGDGGTGNGGGIDNQGAGTTMTLIGCQVVANRSLGGSNGLYGQALGGGILNVFDSVMTLQRCAVTGNQALGGSGSVPTVDFPGVGLAEGGGILNASAALTVIDSSISDNLAAGGATTLGPGGNAFGGGIDNSSLAGTPGTLTLTNSWVADNSAVAGSGGATESPDGILLGVAAGGGLNDWVNGSATVTGCYFVGNQARGGSGGAGVAGGDAFGGGVAVGTNAYFGFADSSSLSMSDSVIVLNLAVGGDGGLGADGGDAMGGGMAVMATALVPEVDDSGGATATLKNTTIVENGAWGGASADPSGEGEGIGGGLYIAPGGEVTAYQGTKIRGNFASTRRNNIADPGGGFHWA